MVRYGSTRKAFILHDEDSDGRVCRYFQNTSPFAGCCPQNDSTPPLRVGSVNLVRNGTS
jgi:hypothetical protein